jgi:hypothetical protein
MEKIITKTLFSSNKKESILNSELYSFNFLERTNNYRNTSL